MKEKIIKVICVIGIFLFVSSCEDNSIKNSDGEIYRALEDPLTMSEEVEDMELVQEFKNIVESKNEPYILIQFIDENIANATEEEATAMILMLEEAQEEYIQYYTDEIFNEDNQMELLKLTGTETFFDEKNIEDIKNIKLKELIEKIIDGKYKILNDEGSFYPVIDYEGMKIYNRYLPMEIKDYFYIRSLNSNEPVLLNKKINISFEDIRGRIMEIEKYIEKYPKGIKFEDVLRIYGNYLKLYLEGSDDFPIWEENGEIKYDILRSYKNMEREDSFIASKVISKYIDLIEENGNIVDESILSKVPELISEAVSNLESIN